MHSKVVFCAAWFFKRTQNIWDQEKLFPISMSAYLISNNTKPPRYWKERCGCLLRFGDSCEEAFRAAGIGTQPEHFLHLRFLAKQGCRSKGKVLITKPPVQPSEANPVASFLWVTGHLGRPRSESLMPFTFLSTVVTIALKSKPWYGSPSHLLIRMDTGTEGLGQEEPGLNPSFSCVQDMMPLKSDGLMLSSANCITSCPLKQRQVVSKVYITQRVFKNW